MEDNTDAHMETDVSSTTEDIAEVQGVSELHRDIETSVSVEVIKEEIMSPTKNMDNKQLDKQPDNTEAKSPPTPKLIVIKAANRTYQIQKPSVVPAKLTFTKSNVKPDTNETKPSSSATKQDTNIVDSSSKAGSLKSPEKSADASPQKGPEMEIQLVVESSVKEGSVQLISSPVKEDSVQSITAIKISNSSERSNSNGGQDKPNIVKELPKPKIILNISKIREKEETEKKSSETISTSTPIIVTPVTELSQNKVTLKEVPKNKTKSDDKVSSLVIETNDSKNKINVEDSAVSISSSTEISQEDFSNDSPIEINSESSDKDHNKSISRELKSLINSAKESKIISECTQLTSKTRKSRVLDNSLTTSDVADKIPALRRASDNSQISNCSEKSDKVPVKRSMRLHNPDTSKGKVDEESDVKPKDDAELTTTPKKKNEEEPVPAKKKKEVIDDATPNKKKERQKQTPSDTYCWRCHWAVEPGENDKAPTPMQCTVCPRSYHYKCLSVQERNKIVASKNWVCPECSLVLQAENSDTRSPAMKKISLGMLCELLNYALERMKDVNGVDPFLQPVDRSAFPDYDTYVVHPMDLSRVQSQIQQGCYGSTEALLADVLWIQHNSIIFNTLQSKMTATARALVRSCRAEMGEIEACPECYAAAHARRPTWFTDVCSTPHALLWAKLKGFPYWPAKCMTVNSAGLVDVRFFGQHDRAWVPARDCFLYSEKDPNNFRTKRQDLLDSMQEAEQHIRNISRKYGKFVYPPFRTLFEPAKLNEQLKLMIPSFEGEVRVCPQKDKLSSTPSTPKDKSRSNSKSSKSSHLEGETSEGEEASTSKEIAKSEDDNETDKTMEVDGTPNKSRETRKRRQSDLQEAVLTVLPSNKDKKRSDTTEKTQESPSLLKPELDSKRKRSDTTEKAPDSPSLLKPELATKTKHSDTTEKTPESPSLLKPEFAAKTSDVKETENPKEKEVSPTKDSDSSSSTSDKDSKKITGAKPATIRVISIAKILKTAIQTDGNTPKPKAKPEKSANTLQEGKTKEQKRRSSKSNKSLNNSNTLKSNENSKDTPKSTTDKNTDAVTPSSSDKRSSKDRIQFDDDVALADLAKKDNKLPTLSSIRTFKSNKDLTVTKTTASPKSVEITVDTPSQSSVFTPTSKDNVKNMKEAAAKLQKLRSDAVTPPVGRVGVRAFARMTSPPKETAKEVEVEIKAEPIDFEDADRHMEKMDLMNAITLKPVNPPGNNLRDVQVHKVVVGPVKKSAVQTTPTPPKPVETRPRAKKTFPTPKKADDSRSELTSKNSMVYIPIQPPITQAPVRAPRLNGPATTTATTNVVVQTPRSNIATNVTSANPPVMSTVSSSPNNTVSVPTVGNTVHTVPLITSVNGQWTFSLQPMMSVGALDTIKSPPMVNGVGPIPGPSQTSGQPGSLIVSGGATLAPNLTPIAPKPKAESLLREPPRLQQKPSGFTHPLDSNAPAAPVPTPSTSGPITAKLNQNAVKLTDFFRTLLEDSLEKVDDPAAQLTAARLQLEQARWRHQQEINEMKHNHELVIAEMRASLEKEKARAVADLRRSALTDLESAVKIAKSKQWCAKCGNEAQFYCCWNTSYCDYPCQRAHWAQHYAVCTQQRAHDNADANSHPSENRLQPAPTDTLPKTTAAPNLTVGGKLAPSRVYTQEISPKPSIIMSMVDEGGTQTMKCVGTYKPTATAIAPLILNKQILNSEEAAKKVVTSGGYLIVGAANAPTATATATTSGNTVVSTSRRVQYFS